MPAPMWRSACATANADGGLVTEIEANGPQALPLQMDVIDLKQCYAAVDAAIAAFGKIDILVNNAGGGVDERPIEDFPEADFDFDLDLNVKSTFFLSPYAGRHMIGAKERSDRQHGVAGGRDRAARRGVYCLSKAAVAHMTKCFAVEWGKHNVRVNCVAPTFIDTDGTAGMLARPGLQRRRDRTHRRAAPHRRAAGGGRCRGVPRLRRRLADHRPDLADRRRLDGALGQWLSTSGRRWSSARSRRATWCRRCRAHCAWPRRRRNWRRTSGTRTLPISVPSGS